MPWLKSSDKAAAHTLVLAVRRVFKADDRSVNEVYGFVSRCAGQSAGYMTDYYVDIGTAELMGGARTQVLLRQAVEAGLLVPEGRGRQRRWRIVEDDDLWHIRAREDVLWERQRDQDRRNPELIARVLLRDGDQCRYCRVVTTSARDTRSGRGRTFDHLDPGQPANVSTYVVCCHRHNSQYKNMPRTEKEKLLRPPPPLPYFSPKTDSRQLVEAFLGQRPQAANDAFVDAGTTSSRGAAAVGATSTVEPAAAGATHLEPGGAAADSATSSEGPAATGATLDQPAGRPPDRSPGEPPRSEGGRRDGTGLGTGLGLEGTGPGAPPEPSGTSPARRGSRGRRGGAR